MSLICFNSYLIENSKLTYFYVSILRFVYETLLQFSDFLSDLHWRGIESIMMRTIP